MCSTGVRGSTSGTSRGSGIYNFPAKWTALLRENLVLTADPLTAVVVRGSLQVVLNSSALFYPFTAQGYARQTVRLNIAYGGTNPSASDIQAHGSTRQQSPGGLWDDTSSASPSGSATAAGSIESGTVDLELNIVVIPGKVLRVEAQVDGDADAGLNTGSYAESGLETQLTLDVQGSAYDATFPFFLAPEPEGALLGAGAIAALAITATRRRR